ncbi:MAG: DUF86 domain-containing protein [Flavobacteriales bacterium]|jgi:uncharacterized protein with HEPN domain|nr:DUF86 domain-containing protein [Flavobacteriales bacterium]MBK7270391.1 DUF86 domain-containing protein [Flavobacteriales bacterium]MBK7751391.1 DUF86 domain-containing protein [Flavobacteriales bacterium]
MSERSDKVRLIDMLSAAERVVRSMTGVNLEVFLADDVLRDAIVYRLQTIGEAAYNLTDALKNAHPEVDWFKIEGLRHRIVHDYRRIDDTQIYRITNKYVPPLVEHLKKILASGVE